MAPATLAPRPRPDRQEDRPVKLVDVSHTYPDGTEALTAVDLEAEPGQVTCLIGPNEAGKSTLLRLVAGALEPTAGTVEADGPVGWLVPYVELADPAEPGEPGALYTVAEWCSQPGAVLLADSPETAAADQTTRDRYAGALVEAKARGAVVLASSHAAETARAADHVVLLEHGEVAGTGPDVIDRGTLPEWDLVNMWRRAGHPDRLTAEAIATGAVMVLRNPSRPAFAVAALAAAFGRTPARWAVIDEPTHARFRDLTDRRWSRLRGPMVWRRRRLLDGDEPAGTPHGRSDGLGVATAWWTVYAGGSPGVLPAADCDRIIEAAAADLVEPGLSADRTRAVIGPDTRGHLATLLNAANCGWWRLDLDDAQVHLLRHGAGHASDAHTVMGPANPGAKLVMAVQLSPPDAYEGGALELCEAGAVWHEQPGEQGAAVVFAGWIPHRVAEVTTGERWALIVWAHGPMLR
jgi:energy-coupling factor transporter ATP-binding protein EcfA2